MDCTDALQLDGVYKKGYGTVPKFVMRDTDLSIESKAIYAYLCALAGSGDCTFPYRDTILRHLGFSKNTYYRHYKPLIDQGYITVCRPLDKRAANIYTLVSNPKKLIEKEHVSSGEGSLKYIGIKSHGYGIILKSVMLDEKLLPKSKALYAYLCSYCGSGNYAFPKRDDIIFHLGISEPTYYKCYNQLRELGYLIAVQRKDKNKFGINDYYINGNTSHFSCTHPKNCDTINLPFKNKSSNSDIQNKASVSYPNFRDTKNRDPIFRDTKNCDSYINNSSSKNSYSKNNPSILQKDEEGRSQIIDQIEKIFDELFSSDNYPFKRLTELSKQKRKELSEEFEAYFRKKIENKQIRNLSAYIKASLVNWLESELLQTKPEQFTGYRKDTVKASYDLSVIEKYIEYGDNRYISI